MVRKTFVSTCMAALVAVVVIPITTGAQDGVQKTLRVTGAQVSVICPLTVGGSFEAKTKALSGEVAVAPGNPQAVNADLLVDLQTLETGIGLRDRHLKNKYLEVERGPDFAQARIRDIRLERVTGKTAFHAMLTLHGQSKAVSGTVDIKPDGDGYRLVASFPVRVSDFGIPEPTYLGVGVKDEVVVRVNMSAAPTAAVATLGRR